MEEWKPVVGYEGIYEVSNLGRVKSLNYRCTGKEGILSLIPQGNGYNQVILYKNGKRKPHLVHRLVAQAFIPNPLGLPDVNHKIDDYEHRSDNRVENLEWCTAKYNSNYGTRNEKLSKSKKGKFLGNKNPKARRVKCITTGEIFGSIADAERKYNINQSNISACCRGKYKSAGKHPITNEKMIWEYI